MYQLPLTKEGYHEVNPPCPYQQPSALPTHTSSRQPSPPTPAAVNPPHPHQQLSALPTHTSSRHPSSPTPAAITPPHPHQQPSPSPPTAPAVNGTFRTFKFPTHSLASLLEHLDGYVNSLGKEDHKNYYHQEYEGE